MSNEDKQDKLRDFMNEFARANEQAEAATQQIASLVVVFYQEVISQGVPQNVAAVLAVGYLNALLSKIGGSE